VFRQYDIQAEAEANQGSLNTKGYITSIRRFKDSENKRDYQKANYPHVSYKVDAKAADDVIKSIEKDRDRTLKAMENWKRKAIGEDLLMDGNGQPIVPLRYQKLGKKHPIVKLFGGSDCGDNCAGWCIDKLEIAGIIRDWPKPRSLAGQCILQ